MQQSNDYALVIGINSYPFYKDLQGAVADAEAFADWLTDDVIGGGLPKSPAANCQLVLNPGAPIGAEIDDALDKIFSAVDLARGNGQLPRRFYLYFSGHGQAKKRDEVNLCLSKWSVKYKPYSALSANECWDAVIGCMGFSEVVVLLDCCRVRLASAAGMPPNLLCSPPIAAAGATRMFKAFSSEFLSQSFEAVNPAQPGAAAAPVPVDEEEIVYSGYFTRALLTALKGAAADQPGGGVSQAALKQYLETEVPRMALANNRVQQPRVPEIDLPPGAVFGSALPQEQNKTYPVTIQFKPGHVGPVTLVLPDNEEQFCPNVTQPWVLQLSKGLHLLIDPNCNPPDKLDFRIPEVLNVTF